MISRRLTKTQKAEILEAYQAGDNTNSLAEKYSCTANTINRTVKTLLSESEYALLKKKRSKISNKQSKLIENQISSKRKDDFEQSNSLIPLEEEDQSRKVDEEIIYSKDFEEVTNLALEDADDFNEDLTSENQNKKSHNVERINNTFEEIAPLISGFDFNLDKQKVNFEILNYESLPESVYMIVDKKVELELQPISDLEEWSFLPENELQRNAILLFTNQRSAKRICSRSQRVIKIPNTNVFKLSKSYLISKGITRLILEDSIIGLDN